jgi:O-antigen/teichoic acid export membrane protein
VTDATKPASFAQEGARVGKNMLAMLISRVLTMVLGFVQTAIILRELEVESVGRYGYALGFTSLFTVFATFGIHRLVVRDVSRDHQSAWSITWSAEAVVAFLNVVLFAVLAGVAYLIEDDPLTRNAVLSAGLWVVVLYALQRPLEGLLMALERMDLVAGIVVAGGILRLGAVYVALKYQQTAAAAHLGISGGNLLALLMLLAVCLSLVRTKHARPRFSMGIAQLRECLPFLASALASIIYFKSDISILKFLAGVEAAGIYMPVLRVFEPIAMIAGLWGTTIFPSLCRLSHESEELYARLQHASLRLGLIIAFFVATGLAAFAEPVIALLAGENAGDYGQSVLVMQWMAVVIPFFYFNSVVQEFLYSKNLSWSVSKCYWIAAAISLSLNILLVPMLGVWAMPLTAICANAAITILFSYSLRLQLHRMGLTHLILKSALSCGAMAAAAFYLMPYTLLGAIAASSVVYAVLQLALGAVNPEERRLLIQAVSRMRG